ncbi:MAG TPA: DNA polymerase [Candidatus Paceibacterota bacterium]|nr:DNA polymerase [Candidatus Paceibacterota bacterium]
MAEEKKQKLILLDSHAILHRGYHALPDFVSTKGEPTGALYGLVALLLKVIRELSPDFLVACYDLPEPTFRHKEFDGYKSTRKKIDDALIAQIKRSRDVFEAFGIPMYELAGFEADDMIGTIAEKCKVRKDLSVVVASGDMDTLQLVDGKRVSVYTLRKGIQDTVIYDEKAVEERFGFEAKFLPDFKGLSGDKSDNIPGVQGIGEKSATLLIQNFGTVENIYRQMEKDETAFTQAGVKPRVLGLLKGNEEEALFSKILGTIRRDAPIDFHIPKKNFWETIQREKVEELCDELEFRTLKARFLALFAENGGEVVEEETPAETEENIPPSDLKKAKIALWLLNSEITSGTLEDILERTREKTFRAAEKKLLEEIKEEGLQEIYDLEVAIMPIIEKAEDRGVLVDKGYLVKLSKEFHKALTKCEKKIWKMAGTEFNINSPKQLGEVLFEKLNLSLKGIKKTAGGAISTRESELQKLRSEHEIIEDILKYRELQKLLSTYIDNISPMLDDKNRLHTTLNQTGTTTGRMSSTSPNLQNIPVREGLGESVRDAFMAPPKFSLVSFDYSQIEMRILAEMSGDEMLLDTFRKGKDVHASVASRVFGVPENEVTKDMRRKAKVINFGIVYGMGVRALRQNLGGTMAEAQDFYDAYFREFPSIANYLESVKKSAREKGYTETLFGRRRYFPEISSRIPYIRSAAERMAINAPIQGTATGDLVKMAILEAEKRLEKKKMTDQVFLLLQIHDELLFEIDERVLPEAVAEIQKAMESVGDLSVPLLVGVKAGARWGSLVPYQLPQTKTISTKV